jgi:carboxylesterase
MSLEWGWLAPRARIEVPQDGLDLRGEGGCRVLLLHGLTGCPAELGYVAHALRSRSRYHVSCPRLVNHGQPMAVLARTTWQELMASARDAFFRARTRARIEEVPLVVGGLSLGAVLSLLLAAEFPQDVAGVVCLAPTLFYDGWSVPGYHRLLPLAYYTPLRHFAYFREQPPYGLRDEALRSKMAALYGAARLDDHSQAAKTGYAHFPVRLFCEMRHLIERCKRVLPEVGAPLLVVQARHDDVTSPRNAEFILQRVASPRRELLLLEQSYHLVCADVERSRVAERMRQFCASLAAQRTTEAPAAIPA